MAPLLTRIGGLPAVSPGDGDPLLPGYIYVAAADRHLDLADGQLRITSAPQVNRAQKAGDTAGRDRYTAREELALANAISHCKLLHQRD